MKVVIFGIGQYCKNRVSSFKNDEIVAFLDNNASEGELFYDVPVYKPQKINELEYDYICLMVGQNFVTEICSQLNLLGVDSEKIVLSDREYFKKKKLKEFHLYTYGESRDNKVVIFVQHLANTGGIRAALYMIETMLKNGVHVSVVSPTDGIIRKELKNKNVDVIITSDISEENDALWKIISSSEIIILNGLYYGYIVSYFNSNIEAKVLWWIHTGESFYSVYPIANYDFCTDRIVVAAVSDLACKAYKEHSKNQEIELLPYWVPDERKKNNVRKKTGKIIFSVIGTISKVKGIDVFLESIETLSEEERNNCEFWIIGADVNPSYSRSIKGEFSHIKNIKWLGEKKHEELMVLFEKIDVLVSSSREDMLPIVTIEALMNEKVCIISDAVGTVGYIKDMYNAVIFRNEDSNDLARIMKVLIGDEKLRNEIGKRGRLVFEEQFSEKSFKQRLNDIFEGELF